MFVLLVVAVLTGCGSSSGGGNSKSMTVKAGEPVGFDAREYAFTPSSLTVKAGGNATQLRITLHNSGAIAHDLRIKRGSQDAGGTQTVTNGKDAAASVKLAPGTYTFYCSVGDHEQLGMKGTLRVE
jgi:plastocyanin